MSAPSAVFHNALLTVDRPETESTYRGEEPAGTETPILRCRCDWQAGGRTLRRARDVYKDADGVAYASQQVNVVEPGDQVEIEHDDGWTATGTVGRVQTLDDKLLVSLDG